MVTPSSPSNSERGSSIVEYLLLIVFFAVFGMTGISSFGRTVGDEFDQVRVCMNSLGGGSMTTTGGIDGDPCEAGGQ